MVNVVRTDTESDNAICCNVATIINVNSQFVPTMNNITFSGMLAEKNAVSLTFFSFSHNLLATTGLQCFFVV